MLTKVFVMINSVSYCKTSCCFIQTIILLDTAALALFFYFLNIYLFIYLLIMYVCMAALGLCCCAQAFSSFGERGLLFAVVHGLLIAVASLVAEHGL